MERLHDYTQSLKDKQALRTVARTFTSLAVANGDPRVAANYARRRHDWADSEQIAGPLLAAVGGQTAAADSSLVGIRVNDLMNVVRPLTILGRLPVRATSFDAALTTMTTGTSSGWVGEAKSAPVSKPAFARLASPLGRLKNVAFSVEDLELVRSGDPNAELTISQDFVGACVQGIDTSFIDATSAAVAGVRPASVTNGAPAFASSGSTAALIDGDLGRMIESLIARGSNLLNAFFILHPITALFMGRLLNVNGDRAYPLLNVRGGELLGLPVLTSASVPHVGSPPSTSIYLLDASRIWVAQDPVMEVSVSQRGAIQMSDVPTGDAGASPVATTLVSMFQSHSIALRGTRVVNWKIADPGFACVLANVAD